VATLEVASDFKNFVFTNYKCSPRGNQALRFSQSHSQAMQYSANYSLSSRPSTPQSLHSRTIPYDMLQASDGSASPPDTTWADSRSDLGQPYGRERPSSIERFGGKVYSSGDQKSLINLILPRGVFALIRSLGLPSSISVNLYISKVGILGRY
jgi:hypothetical protein